MSVAGRSVYLPLSIKHNIDLGSREALRRGVMHLFNIDFALEWPRALPPNVKLVGPLMTEPPRALPADLQVHAPSSSAASRLRGSVWVSQSPACAQQASGENVSCVLAALEAVPSLKHRLSCEIKGPYTPGLLRQLAYCGDLCDQQ